MKWSDLTLKERKQIYDAVRAENPNASYFDIKSQFDSIPEYEDGGKKIMPPKELGLTPGTPEYYKRQQQISGRAELVQPEAYVTPAGYIKDAITTAEELEKGNYGNAAVSTLMNAIPWGVGKGLRKIKSRVSNTLNTPIEIHSSMVDEYPSIELVKGIDTAYGTDYLDAYKRIAARDMTGRGKYIKYAELPGNKNAKISRVRDVQDYGPVVDDYVITIDPLQYLPGTANHELGHLADQLASDANNRYLTYLLDEGNIMGPGELRSKGINVGSDMQSYLLDPMEFITPLLLPVAGYETNKE